MSLTVGNHHDDDNYLKRLIMTQCRKQGNLVSSIQLAEFSSFQMATKFLPSVVFIYESLRSTKIMVLLFLEIMQPQCQIHVQVWYKPTVAKGFSINLAQEIITSCLGHNMAFTTIPSLIFSYLSLRCFCTPLNPETPIGD